MNLSMNSMGGGRSYGHDDYEVGDEIVYKSRMGEKRVVKVEQKNADMNPCDPQDNRSGFDGEVVEADDEMSSGDNVWGYDSQIVEVRS